MTKIYYFSGTGNTLWSAKKIAEIIGDCELYNMGAEIHKSKLLLEADAVILLFPSYAYGLPIIVRHFLNKAVFKTPYVASFVTYGTSPGGTLAEACWILGRKKIKNKYYGRIPAVENYIAIFGYPKEKTMQRRLAMQRDSTADAARLIIERKVNHIFTLRIFSFFVSGLFTMGIKIFYRYYKVADNCDGCGICEKVCPVSAISLKNGRPVFSGACEHCQGCFNWCPKRSINFARLTPKKPRYHHPEIAFKDIRSKSE